MSLNVFPAMPGTCLIQRKQGDQIATLTPVIAFQQVAEHRVLFPLTVMPSRGLTLGVALVTPDGMVSDPAAGMVYKNTDEWMAHTATAAYWKTPQKAEPVAAKKPAEDQLEHYEKGDVAVRAADVSNRIVDIPKDETGIVEKARIPDKPKGKPQQFQTTSFWKMADNSHIFIVEGGKDAPAKNDTTYEKIRRDDFAAMKKAGTPVVSWPIVEAPDAEDDDDGRDLI